MKWTLALPVLGALAFVGALPDKAEAGSRSSFDISVGIGSSYHHGYHRGYDSGVSFRYSTGRSYGHHHHHSHHRPTRYYSSPRYYAPRTVYRETYYRPAPRYYSRDYDHGYHSTVRYYSPSPRYYSSDYYCR